jgi:hypothetical protein
MAWSLSSDLHSAVGAVVNRVAFHKAFVLCSVRVQSELLCCQQNVITFTLNDIVTNKALLS